MDYSIPDHPDIANALRTGWPIGGEPDYEGWDEFEDEDAYSDLVEPMSEYELRKLLDFRF